MTAREYLAQARYIDHLIDTKLEQLAQIRETATKATMTLSDMPRSNSPNLQTLESTVVKIVDMEHEIDADIDRLVDLKREIQSVIQRVRNPLYKTLLELRYLGFKTWEEISEIIDRDISNVYRANKGALRAVESIMMEMHVNDIS